MANLTIKDIINNAIDEFQRAKDTIEDLQNECRDHLGINGTLTDTEMLIEDINNSIERLSSIEDTVLVALVAAVYAGNIESDGKGFNGDFGADSLEHIREYLAMAEQYDLPYTEDGHISTEDVYNDISDMIQRRYAQSSDEKNNLPNSVIITADDVKFDTDELLSDIVSNYLSDTYGYCHCGFDMRVIRYKRSRKIHCIEVTNIQWDTDTESSESEDEK